MSTLELDRLHLGAISDPTQTTDPAIWQPSSILGTIDFFKEGEWIFGASNAAQPTVKISIHVGFKVPRNYVGTPLLLINWTATLTSGNVVWDADYRTVSGDDTTSLDQATAEESVTVTDAAPTATDRQLATTVALTGANLTAGEWFQLVFSRDGADAADTMAGSARLRNLSLVYNDA